MTNDKTAAHTCQDISPTSNENPNPLTKKSHPKKPLSAYIYFSQEHREVLKKKYPAWSSTEVMKRVSVAWQQMSKDEKIRYTQMAAKDRARYEQEQSGKLQLKEFQTP
jgi:hypothetical protein